MAKDDQTIHLISAHDGGNGFMKDQVNDSRYIFPSVMSEVLPGKELETIDINDTDSVETTLDDFLNKIDVTINSESLNESGRYFVGEQATIGGTTPINFNVNSTEGKSSSDISLVCLFSLLSYVALKQYYSLNSTIPDHLNVIVDKMATALPIDEIKLAGVQSAFTQRFTSNNHQVTINNFNVPVKIDLSFTNVFVDPEGVAAVTGLIFDPEYLNYRQGEIFDDLIEEYDLDSFTGKDILTAGNVLTIDIGDGTIDLAVTNKGTRVPNENRSILSGVGNVAENAIAALRQAYPVIAPMDRQTFMQIANRDRGANDKESHVYKQYLDQQTIILERQILEQVKDFHRDLHGQIGMIILCGGGASLLKQHFHSSFKKEIDKLFPLSEPYILWVDSQYSQQLNLDGLMVRAKIMK